MSGCDCGCGCGKWYCGCCGKPSYRPIQAEQDPLAAVMDGRSGQEKRWLWVVLSLFAWTGCCRSSRATGLWHIKVAVIWTLSGVESISPHVTTSYGPSSG
jgi:hypothetical protein